jgi:pimeloyl-ACP methyl ester carboxylesterase
MRVGLAFALAVAAVACSSDDGGDDGRDATRVRMDFDRPDSLYDAPFPSDDLRGATVDVSTFPNPEDVAIVEQARTLVEGRDGFATSGGVFFQVTASIDPASLPDVAATVEQAAPVFLVDIDPASPRYGRRSPVEVEYEEFGGLYAVPRLISLLPLQGVPLRADTRYAAVITTAVRDLDGEPLAAATANDLAGIGDPLDALIDIGVDPATIAGATAFTTGDPTAELMAVRDAAIARGTPALNAPFARTDLFDEYCVYQTTIDLPDYQSGQPPYRTEGGTWQLDADGEPILQREATATLVVTIPRAPMPDGGYPLAVFVRTGGGGNRPLVDRGRRAEPGGPAVVPGEGPALYFARAGFAGLQVDGPHGGLRNATGGDEQFLMFNVQNLGALRDNVRQSAVELVVIASVAQSLTVDATDCPPAGTTDPGPLAAGFDTDKLALMGHSMGATIAPLTTAAEPMYRALILSGAGGSWIENIVYKRKPLEVAPIIGLLLHQGFDVRTDDPVLTLAQWALEPADPQVYGDVPPQHVLMLQGIVDNYILPRIANTTSLSLGLDLAGGSLDDTGDPRLDGQTPLAPMLPLVGRGAIELPVSGNIDGEATAVVVQHEEDGVEDGHEVVFQTEAPKHQYQCFLSSWLDGGAPVVPERAGVDAPCQ